MDERGDVATGDDAPGGEVLDLTTAGAAAGPDVDLRVAELEEDLVERAAGATGVEDLVTCLLRSDDLHAEVVRHHEARVFPEIPALMAPYESRCEFLAVLDTRPERRRLVHAFRLSCARPGYMTVLVTDLLASGQGLDAADFASHYDAAGVDLDRSGSVESNFRVAAAPDSEGGLPPSQVGYLATFEWVRRNRLQVLFAHLNAPAVKSLTRIGVTSEPIAGHDGLQTPALGGGFDASYWPVAIPVSTENVAVFEALVPFASPEFQPDGDVTRRSPAT